MNSPRSFLIAVLFLVLAAVSVVTWREHQALIFARTKAGPDNRADLQKRIADTRERVKGLQDKVIAQEKAATTAQKSGRAGAANRDTMGDRFRAARESPDYKKLVGVQQKAALDTKYAALFRTLTRSFNLSPEQVDQFKDLLAQRLEALKEGKKLAAEERISPQNDPENHQLVLDEATKPADQGMKDELGLAGYAQYQQYEQTMLQRATVNQVQSALAYSQAPLSDDEANQLTALLAQDAPPKGGPGVPTNPGSWIMVGGAESAPITAQALIDAQSFLTPQQIAALKRVQQALDAEREMAKLMQAARNPPPGG